MPRLSPVWCCIAAVALAQIGCGDDSPPAGSPRTSSGGATSGAGGAGGQGGGSSCEPTAAFSEELTLSNGHGTLGGVLDVPEGCAPFDVVMFIGGTGTSDRDGNAATLKPNMYLMLAAELRADLGVATFRFDDHGIGESVSAVPPLDEFTVDFEVNDAAGWVSLLREDARVDRIVIAGHSQGSLTGMLVHDVSPIDGLISLAGAGRPAGDLLREQLADDLTAAQLEELDAIIEQLENGELPGPVDPPLDKLFHESTQPWLVSYLKHDPKELIAAFSKPALIVQGTTDLQVKVLDAQLLKEGKPDAELAIIEDMAHTLKQADDTNAQQNAAYSDATVPLADGLVSSHATWYAATFGSTP